MTCKDCLHYEVCQHHDAVVDFPVDDGVCRFFEDRTKWVEQKHGRCKWCSGDYHTTLLATAVRHHSNGNMEGYELSVNYCPNCGAKMDGDGNG